ncbi:MAG: polyhydroxyalkanoate synthesis repressor PhaR, partial [Kordiimonadaceae bacterium]|nr:polyhydroxyalkanoate synthesis repressor PhaR [Kordiimonadaceae bacterium]
VPSYLASTMDVLNRHKEQIQLAFGGTDNGNFMPLFEEMTRQNMAFFDQTMQAFTRSGPQATNQQGPNPHPEAKCSSPKSDELTDLKDQLAALKEKVDKLS